MLPGSLSIEAQLCGPVEQPPVRFLTWAMTFLVLTSSFRLVLVLP